MTVYAIVSSLTSGHENDREQVKNLNFKIGDKFEVENISMGQSYTSLTLKEFPKKSFNSSNFNFEEDGKELNIFNDKRFNPYLSFYG